MEDRIGFLALLEGFGREGVVHRIDRGAADEGLLELQREAALVAQGGQGDLRRGGDLGPDAVPGEEGHRIGVLLRHGGQRRGGAGEGRGRGEGRSRGEEEGQERGGGEAGHGVARLREE